ncbi:hypothetical protein ACM61V_15370 [Sphingomonas sp. TX0543]|nr:hypothetical protein [Sphingomonas sp. 3P27F8]
MEFLAIATAVKKLPGLAVQTAALPIQAIIADKDTWIDGTLGMVLDRKN